MRGRPTKLTPELIERVRNFSQIGMTWKDVATVSGVSLATVSYWRKVGERETERRTRGRNPIAKFDLYCDFLDATLKARLASKYRCTELIYSVAAGRPKAEEGMTNPN